MIKINQLLLLSFVPLIMFSCASTRTIGSFTDKSFELSKYKDIGIVVMHPRESVRAIVEEDVYEELAKKGIPAEPTINLFPFAARQDQIEIPGETPEEKQKRIKARIEKFGIDGILLIAILDEKVEIQQRGGNVGVGIGAPYSYSGPYGYHPYGYYGYYNHVYTQVNTPTYYTTSSTYFLECNFYDVESGNLVRSIQTKTSNLQDLDKEAHEYGRLIAYELTKKE